MSTSSWTDFGLREGHDIQDIAPTGASTAINEWYGCDSGCAGTAGSNNTGGGGGGKYSSTGGYAGGNGIVIIRAKTSDFNYVSGGKATVLGDYTILVFNSNGVFHASISSTTPVTTATTPDDFVSF